MNICAIESSRKADQELNAVYKKLLAKIEPESREKLRAAEQAWMVFRDRQCAFDTLGTEGGSVHPMIVSGCYERYTHQQIENLRMQLDCEEGNLSCGRQ